MQFHPGPIHGVIWKPLRKFHDARGWLCELFRHDELPAEFHPVMAYISETAPGVARGPRPRGRVCLKKENNDKGTKKRRQRSREDNSSLCFSLVPFGPLW